MKRKKLAEEIDEQISDEEFEASFNILYLFAGFNT